MRTLLRRSTALLFAAAAFVSAQAPAQIYECIDARGAREFAQVCSPGTVSQRQVHRGDESPGAVPGAKSLPQQDVEFKKRLQERQDAEAKASSERAKTEEADRNCTQARTQLKGLLEGQRMMRVDPDTGDRVNLGDEERAADAERQQKLVEQWCKP
jgi:hypothetical protein